MSKHTTGAHLTRLHNVFTLFTLISKLPKELYTGPILLLASQKRDYATLHPGFRQCLRSSQTHEVYFRCVLAAQTAAVISVLNNQEPGADSVLINPAYDLLACRTSSSSSVLFVILPTYVFLEGTWPRIRKKKKLNMLTLKPYRDNLTPMFSLLAVMVVVAC